MKKRIFIFLVCIATLLCLVSCEDSNNETSKKISVGALMKAGIAQIGTWAYIRNINELDSYAEWIKIGDLARLDDCIASQNLRLFVQIVNNKCGNDTMLIEYEQDGDSGDLVLYYEDGSTLEWIRHTGSFVYTSGVSTIKW